MKRFFFVLITTGLFLILICPFWQGIGVRDSCVVVLNTSGKVHMFAQVTATAVVAVRALVVLLVVVVMKTFALGVAVTIAIAIALAARSGVIASAAV